MHTHPGNPPQPSSTDSETFERVFGSCQHTVMFIVARGRASYCRLRFNAGPGGEMLIPVEVDYRKPFVGADHGGWERDFMGNIRSAAYHYRPQNLPALGGHGSGDDRIVRTQDPVA